MKHLFLIVSLLWVFTSCSKKDEAPAVSIDQPQLQIHFDEEHQFVLTQGNNTLTASQYQWTSSNETVGTVDANGTFTGNRIGETTVTGVSADGKNRVESKVTVIPYVASFVKEPALDFGNSKATVKAKETRTLVQETDNTLEYQGENAKLRGVGYQFENAALINSILFLTVTNQVAQEAVTYYYERYDVEEGENELYVAISDKVVMGLLVDDSAGLVAVYVPFDFASGGRVAAKDLKQLFKGKYKAGKNASLSLKQALSALRLQHK
ncbi:hypothetical protein BWI97_06815 [Siphonobacter sp. BAB-5405]|uniref:Ig-like domain-containing protein n=1 Tax=unclassified Siphonobacter TaxID=2635712 RepID=UPI000C8055C5|nr:MULTISPECIES: Ig-like domain-containing protein [unclassified Siphonobacter]PMD97338.1 hypothetical protein BWI97_06815 [Siphonobacter sp. BAB-5405]